MIPEMKNNQSYSDVTQTHSLTIPHFPRGPRVPRAPRVLNENRSNLRVSDVASHFTPIPDPETAARFLNFMGNGKGLCNLRAFADKPEKRGNNAGHNSALPFPINPQDLDALCDKNTEGNGVFWVVNEGGQKTKDITAPRALFVDYDGDDLDGFMNRLSAMPPPHAIVESSPRKRHVYWKCQGVPVEQFKALQQGLIAQLGTDKSIYDLPRVMRVPGFVHQKGKPYPVRLLRIEEKQPDYTLEQCIAFAKPESLEERGRPERAPRTPRQPKLTAQATPPADNPLAAYFSANTKEQPTWVETENIQREYDRTCIGSAIKFLADDGYAEDHSDWQAVGAALKGCTRSTDDTPPILTDDEAFSLFDQFSKVASNYDPDGVATRWENIGTNIYGCGALLDKAKNAGWKQPPHPNSAEAKREQALTETSTSLEREAEKVGDGDLITNSKGQHLPCLANAVAFLGRAAKTKNAFRYNELTGAIDYHIGGAWRPLVDADIPPIQIWMQRANNMHRITRGDVEYAILARAMLHRHHPIREWMNALHWDGVPRIDTWLPKYLDAVDSEYTRLVGRLFLISMVARIQKPGCKVDTMLILEGQQGAGKSSALKVLAGSEYFSDALPEIGSKDASLAFRGRWLIEVAELAASSKAEAEHLKAFLSRDTERYRPPFGRLEVSEPRQCVLVGTTNASAYLKDASGARRFWPVLVGKIDLEALERDREQLFAEALHLYQSGAIWWPTTEQQQALFMPEQDARFEADPWECYVAQYLQEASEAAKKEGKECRVTVAEIAACRGINLEVSRTTTRENRRIVAILQRLEWIQKRTARTRYYVKA